MEIAENIERNYIHKERFFTTHQVYDKDHLLHQVLYKALLIIDQFSNGTWLYDKCKRVLLNFPEISEKKITRQILGRITLNRKSNSYEYAIDLAKLIILNYSPDISSGQVKMLSLLFDMNQLWEAYVLKQVRKSCEGTDIEVEGQGSKGFWGGNNLRPDIILRKGKKTYIIDTKWKIPYSSSASVSDLRQMYTYCRFWNADQALLLYPGNPISNEFKEFQTDDFIGPLDEIRRIRHRCKMGFVSVIDPMDNQLDSQIGTKVLSLLTIDSGSNPFS